jgi:FAD binding domain/Berberine and berberine like
MTIMETAVDLRQLRRQFKGAVLTPRDAGWDAARQAYNLTVDQTPALIAVPLDEQDAITIVNFARENGLQVAPQRTGHNASPMTSLEDVILVKTDAMRGVQIDVQQRTARVRAGSKWEDVVPRASDLGLAALHGSTPDVSVAGYSLGGGVGWYGRKLGLSANSVRAIELVTADGRLRRVDHRNEPELFWALRGGGGNFGLVTAVEIDLYAIPEVYAGVLFFPWERSSEVLHAWHAWTKTVPDEVTSVGRILQFPDLDELPPFLRARNFVVVEAFILTDEAEGRKLLEPIRALGPEIDTVAMVPPVGLAELHMDPPNPVPYAGAHHILGDLDADAIETVVEFAGPGSGSPLVSYEIRHIGGAFARPEPHHGSLGTLDGSFLTFGIGMVVDEESAHSVHEALKLIDEKMARYANGREYLNFAEDPTDSSRFYRPEAYRRLRAVKAEVDPGNLFRANHPIPPAA